MEPARHAVWHVRLRGLRRAVASCTNHVWGCGPSSLQHLTQLSCKALRTGIVLTVISVPASTYSSSKMDAELWQLRDQLHRYNNQTLSGA